MSSNGVREVRRAQRHGEWPEIVFAGDRSRQVLSAAAKRGTILRLASGIYSGRPSEAPDRVVRRNWAQVLGHEFPGAIIADRSARRGSPDAQGRIAVVHSRRRPLDLPGLAVLPRQGRGPVDGDTAMMNGLFLSSPARSMLENIAGRGERYLTRDETERWLADLMRTGGEARLNDLRDLARRIAPDLGRESAFRVLDRMVGATLATHPIDTLRTPALRSYAAGGPDDASRIDAFGELAATLRGLAPRPLSDLPADAARRDRLPFYEAYFSNDIEGTRFTLDEAEAIVFGGEIPIGRPADAHDIIGTYLLVSDATEMARVPESADDLVTVLRTRHRVVMERRPDQHPGLFKERSNQAGSTVFVVPELVEGTLRIGFEIAGDVTDAFARAVYLMFLVTEVHPFDDGNGRIARVMMNAELVHAGQVRIIVPTVYRDNYLASLKGATHNRSFGALIDVLTFAQRYTARVDFSTRESAEADLVRTNALLDSRDADESGRRLQLP